MTCARLANTKNDKIYKVLGPALATEICLNRNFIGHEMYTIIRKRKYFRGRG